MRRLAKGSGAGNGAAALLVLVALLLVTVSCDQHSRGSFLQPSGGPGEAFVSRWSLLQIVGDFNSWNTGIPSMQVDDAGVWRDTLTVQDGCYLMKIRTEGDWDETPDFGRCSGTEEDCQLTVPADGDTAETDVCEAAGEGTAIGQLEFTEAGSYEFAYHEPDEVMQIRRLTEVGEITGTVAFATRGGGGLPIATVTVLEANTANEITQVSSSDTDGSYTVVGLPPATYDVLIQASGYVEQRIDGIAVVAFETADVGLVTLEVGCTSLYTAIQIVGDLNSWNESIESMSKFSECVWVDTLDVAAGCSYMKFRTDLDWDDTPDFGRCSGTETDCSVLVPSDGTALVEDACPATGTGTAIGSVEFPQTGTYEFALNEATGQFTIRALGGPAPVGSLSGTVAFDDSPSTLPAATVRVLNAGTTTEVATTTTDIGDGSWSVTDLAAGDYDVEFSATDYVTQLVTTQTVTPPSDTVVPLTTLVRVPVGSISGIVSFSDSPSPRPIATVRVYEAGTTNQVGAAASSVVDGAFSVGDLLAGSYDLEVTADGYDDGAAAGVTVTALMNTDVGAIVLDLQCATQLQIVGDFNGWDSSAPFMSNTGTCTWADTLAIPDGCYRIKLRTNDDWDATLDWGGCGAATACADTIPSTGAPNILPMCRTVGLKDALGEVVFDGGGTYEFQVDESIQRIFMRRVGP